MTALNVIQTHDAIHFFSDGAFIDPRNCHLVSTGPKVMALPAARCVIGVSGPLLLLEQLSCIGNMALSIEQVLHDIEKVLPTVLEQLFSNRARTAFEINIGGFSEAGERQLWRISGFTDSRDFYKVRCDADAWIFSPVLMSSTIERTLGKEQADIFNRGFVQRLDCSGVADLGMIAIEAQRRIKTSDQALLNGSAHTVGVFAQCTTVTFDKIESRILKRWPDVTGARINPEGAAKVYQSSFGAMYFTLADAVGFKSADGINAGSSANYSLDTTNGLVKPTSTTGTMISAATGTLITDIATRTSAIFDSVTNQPSSSGAQKASATSMYAGKTYSGGKAVGKAMVYGTNNLGFVSGTPSITINLRGKNGTAPSSPSNGTLLGTLTFTNTSNESAGRTINSTDTTTLYDHVFVEILQSAGAGTMCLAEVQFYAPGTTSNMTLVTTAQATDASMENARCLIVYDNTAAPTLNTDLTVELSCDGGSTWSPTTLALVTAYGPEGLYVAETDDVACTAGTSFTARIKTLNSKLVELHGVSISVH